MSGHQHEIRRLLTNSGAVLSFQRKNLLMVYSPAKVSISAAPAIAFPQGYSADGQRQCDDTVILCIFGRQTSTCPTCMHDTTVNMPSPLAHITAHQMTCGFGESTCGQSKARVEQICAGVCQNVNQRCRENDTCEQVHAELLELFLMSCT